MAVNISANNVYRLHFPLTFSLQVTFPFSVIAMFILYNPVLPMSCVINQWIQAYPQNTWSSFGEIMNGSYLLNDVLIRTSEENQVIALHLKID